MEIFRSLDEITLPSKEVVATIGNFDGVHLGHREIFRRIRQRAAEINGLSMVVTFVPHPLKVVQSAKKHICLINTYAEKETLINASGVDYLVEIPFTADFAELSAREFVKSILVERLRIKHLIIGYDYSFGRGREGKVSTLLELGQEFGFEVEVLEPIGCEGTIYSSTQVRKMLKNGEVSGVVPLLGRQFSIAGTVVSGHKRGVGLGFPTANIKTDKELIPKDGVYAVKVKSGERLFDGACNIGTNPTFDDDEVAIEVFLFDFNEDLYGSEIRIYFVERLRDEQRFSGPDELRFAIERDVARSRDILKNTGLIEYREYLQGEDNGR